MLDIDDDLKEQIRAQVGIGTLIVFIAMVLVAAIAAGVLINTAGFLQSKSEATGQQSGEQVTNRLQVLQASGVKTDIDSDYDPETIGGIELMATKAPGAEDITLTGITIQWVDDTGIYDLVHENEFGYTSGGSAEVDGAFAHRAVKDEDDSLTGSSPVINTGDDRAVVAIDIGRPDVLDDNTIGEAYNNHTYDINDYSTADESTVKDDVLDSEPNTIYYEIDSSEDGVPVSDTEGGTQNYIAGKVIRSDVTNDNGKYGIGLEGGTTASIRITTTSGTASTVQLVVPESLSGKTAVRL